MNADGIVLKAPITSIHPFPDETSVTGWPMPSTAVCHRKIRLFVSTAGGPNFDPKVLEYMNIALISLGDHGWRRGGLGGTGAAGTPLSRKVRGPTAYLVRSIREDPVPRTGEMQRQRREYFAAHPLEQRQVDPRVRLDVRKGWMEEKV
jgi:hypothetical protein